MNKMTPKKIFRIVLLVSTAISLYFVPWPIVTAWLKPTADSVTEQITEGLDYGFDGVIVYVDKTGDPPLTYAAGYHDTREEIPARPDALFKIASVSKLYVAVSIAKLVNKGQLPLDKSLADYFPELDGRIEYANEITLRMMVGHRSGIPNFTDMDKFWEKPPASSKETLELVLDQPANFEPDTDYGYSNTNYLLLRELIRNVTGHDHFEYIREEILVPLKLNQTYGSLKEVNMDDVMSGYYVGHDADLRPVEYGMLATAKDVGIFLRALNDGSVFKEGEQEIYSSIYVYDHTGLVPGYQTIAKYHEDMDAVVIQFTNTVDFEGYNWNLSEVLYGKVVKIVRREKNE